MMTDQDMSQVPPPLKRARSSATGASVLKSGSEPSASTSTEEPKKIKAQTEGEAQLENETELSAQTWEDLKELWENAMEEFEGSEPASAVPLLRGLIFECDRIVRNSSDPDRPLQPLSTTVTVDKNGKNSKALWDPSTPSKISSVQVGLTEKSSDLRKEHPEPLHPGQALSTFAFFHIYGTTLLTLADIFDQEPDLADPSEPSPVIINAKSIDFFGKALQGYQDEFTESEPRSPLLVGEGRIASDWRLEIAWGRALVRIARKKLEDGDEEELLRESAKPSANAGKAKGLMGSKKRARQSKPEPVSTSAPASPTSLAKTPVSMLSPRQLLTQAADHFQLGILLMPRPSPSSTSSDSEATKTTSRDPITSFQPNPTSHQRLKTILEIAISISPLVEKFSDQKERVRWATWTGGIFDQLEMEAPPVLASSKGDGNKQEEDWRFEVAVGKGGLWLGLGSRLSEEFETSFEARDKEQSKAQAELLERRRIEAREFLQKALEYLKQGREIRPRPSTVQDSGKDGEEDEVGPLLVEGYLTLSGLVDPDDDEEIARLEGLARQEGWVEDENEDEDEEENENEEDDDEDEGDEDEEDMSVD